MVKVTSTTLYSFQCNHCRDKENATPSGIVNQLDIAVKDKQTCDDAVRQARDKGWDIVTTIGAHLKTNISEVTCPTCLEKIKARLRTSTDIIDRINGDYYDVQQADQYNRFVEDVLAHVQISNHPKAKQIFQYIWERYRDDGLIRVVSEMEEFVHSFIPFIERETRGVSPSTLKRIGR